MSRDRKLAVWVICAVAAAASQAALGDTKAKVDAGLAQTKQLLKLMDTDQNGKVSKQEFLRFMEAEFDQLDVNKDGELDVKELTRLPTRLHIDNR